MPDLEVSCLAKSYPTRGEPLSVLRNVSFELTAGESAAILGPSGCGKSTLLQILGTLQRPTSGTLELLGTDPFQLGEADLAKFRNEQVGFIFQDHHLLPQLSALENILVPAVATGKPTAQQVSRAHELLKRVGLADRAQHRPSELSGGERQRVATARALINEPKLLLADEPTGNLDRTTAGHIADLLREVQDSTTPRTIMIVVTHSQELAQRFQRRWELDAGQLRE